jgi:hypothetical protein
MPSLLDARAALLALAACGFASASASAANPIVQTSFTADPAPVVFGDTVFLYTTHDEDDALEFKMIDWKLYTSKDMVNWTDHGTVADLSIFPWANQHNDAWAPQVVARNGKYYLYAPVTVPGSPSNVIGVAVSDSPYGPFKDPLGHPLIGRGEGNFDPTVLIDDDGQAYLYWGNPHLSYVKLNRDMISYSGEIKRIDAKPRNYQEGPWVYKRNGKYYLAYASSCCSEGLGYAMSDSPTGPWEYKGQIMDPSPLSTGNHPGIIDFKGKSYVFGLNYRLNWAETPIHHERRSVNVADFTYRPDGTIPTLPFWNTTGVQQLEPLSPYRRVEAETIAWESRLKRDRDMPFDWAPGVRSARDPRTGMYITPVAARAYVQVAGVDFGRKGPKMFTASVASEAPGGKIEVRAGSPEGTLIATVEVPATGGASAWRSVTVPAANVTGVQDVYLVLNAHGRHVPFGIDYWQFD